MPTSWTVGGRLADRFAGRPEYARAKGAEGAEDAEDKGACTLAVQMNADKTKTPVCVHPC